MCGMVAAAAQAMDEGARWSEATFERSLVLLVVESGGPVQASQRATSARIAAERLLDALLACRRQTMATCDAAARRLDSEAAGAGTESAQSIAADLAMRRAQLCVVNQCIDLHARCLVTARMTEQALEQIVVVHPVAGSGAAWRHFQLYFREAMTPGTFARRHLEATVEAARIAPPDEAGTLFDRHLEAIAKRYVPVPAAAILAPGVVETPVAAVPRPRARASRARRVAATGPPPAEPAPEPPSRPAFGRYLTSREAAIYLGFKSTSAIRKAVFDGRLRPIGRRGGRGTHLFTIAELDRFARGDPPATVGSDRPGAPEGDAHGQRNEVDQAVEVLGGANAPPGRVEAAGRRAFGPSPRGGSHHGPDTGNQEGLAERGRTDRVHMADRGTRTHPVGRPLGAASADALRRIRSVVIGEEGHGAGHQKRSKP